MGLPVVETERYFVGVEERSDYEDDRFRRYQDQNGILPKPLYSQVRTLSLSPEYFYSAVSSVSTPTRAQAETMMERAGVEDDGEEIVVSYSILRNNTLWLFDGPEEPEQDLLQVVLQVFGHRLRYWKNVPSWCDQEVFAEALLIHDRNEEHQRFTASLPHIFPNESDNALLNSLVSQLSKETFPAG